MLTSKEFVAKLVADNQALFQASQHNVKAYFDSKPAQEELVQHFVGRMVNERMNMVEISQAIANMPADADPVELQLLCLSSRPFRRSDGKAQNAILHCRNRRGWPLVAAERLARSAPADQR